MTLENELNKLDNQLESEYQALLQKYSVLKDEKKTDEKKTDQKN